MGSSFRMSFVGGEEIGDAVGIQRSPGRPCYRPPPVRSSPRSCRRGSAPEYIRIWPELWRCSNGGRRTILVGAGRRASYDVLMRV
jgi:hypothetical protein